MCVSTTQQQKGAKLTGVYVRELVWRCLLVLVKWRCYGGNGRDGVAVDATTNG